MGQEILYCYKCSTRIMGTDLDKGAAFQVGNRTACKACAQELLDLLPPAEREMLRARMSRATPEKGGSSSRMPRAGDTPRSTARVALPAPAQGPSKKMLLAIGGAVLLVILLAVLMSGGREHPVAQPDPGIAEGVEREAAERRDREREAARARDVASRDFAALEAQVKEFQFREEFKKGLDLLAGARSRRGGADWQSVIDRKDKELREIPKGLYPGLKEKALDARRRDAGAEVKVVEDRIAKWGLEDLAADLKGSLAAVVIEPGPFRESAEGLVVFEAENFHAKVDVGEHAWTVVAEPPGFEGKGALQALPNTNTPIEVDKSPRVDWKVNFVKTGVHYVWIRCAADSGTDDSLFFGLDGVKADPANYFAIDAKKKWLWSNKLRNSKEAKIDVTAPGVHTFSLWMREDGAAVDRIVLTAQPKYPVTGGGPPESGR
jgi:hypothetical protein